MLDSFTSEFIFGSLAIVGLVLLAFAPYLPYVLAIWELKKSRKMYKCGLSYDQGDHLFINYKNGFYQIALKRKGGIQNIFGYILALFVLIIPYIFSCLVVAMLSDGKFDFNLDWPILILWLLPTAINTFYSILLLSKLCKKVGGFKVLLLLIDNNFGTE